ncbi:UPF0481 protein [Ananas comosus]|uniref:UPF0481 protein n=1 Tax=Ananas comosus TaxID=4615 RepID=A0A199VB14_ANACO|nr:UPF0481 protein [Ananas comosus]
MTGGESSREADEELDELESSMTRELNYYWSLSETYDEGSNVCSIHRVPPNIRDVDRNAYVPITLSVGPYYHGHSALQAMEKAKWDCLDYILKLNREVELQDYVMAIERLEEPARKCYSEEIKMDSKQFLQMLLLDGCFILVYLYGLVGFLGPVTEVRAMIADHQKVMKETGENDVAELEHEMGTQHEVQNTSDQIGPLYNSCFTHDLLLLENQIPFFVVQRIYDLLSSSSMVTPSLTNNITKQMEVMLRPSQKTEEDHRYQERATPLEYLLYFGRKYLKLGNKLDKNVENSSVNRQSDLLLVGQQRWRRAVQYHEAGVEFKIKEFDEHNPHSLLDIEYSNGVVGIPCLPIDENTVCVFRNLIAFEQTCPRFGNDITAYIFFMSQLISTPNDVTLLAQRGIIVHQLRRDAEVSSLFTKLNKDVVFDFNGKYYLKSMFSALEAHYQSRLNRWVAWLRNNHFSNPWLALGVLAATIVLFCTLVQTLIAVLSYVKPP